ncbi:MAG: hypothetical protein K0S29_874 [Gammaproteobacteria bacterium]|jgi:hypothetical protein|nr:hypothetical protein [Gammaproteobacteria bacterium]
MRTQNSKSIGIELAEQYARIICLQKRLFDGCYQVLASYELLGEHEPNKLIEQLVFHLKEGLSILKLNNIPVFIALSEKLVNQKLILIEGDIFRLKPHMIDRYVFARAQEAIEQSSKDFYLDYSIVSSDTSNEHIEVMVSWIAKISLIPYVQCLKKYKLKANAVELPAMANQRFHQETSSIEGLEVNFITCCGAAMRNWKNASV